SQVVVLEDEGEADEAAATVARSGRRPAAGAAVDEEEAEEGATPLFDEEAPGLEEEDEELAGRAAVAAPPAEWGPLPALVLAPCVVVLLLVGMMGFEMLHAMWGYRSDTKVNGVIIRPLAEAFADFPKDR